MADDSPHLSGWSSDPPASPTRRAPHAVVPTLAARVGVRPVPPVTAAERHVPQPGILGLGELFDLPADAPPGHLERIVRTAVTEIEGARWATVTVPEGRRMVTVAATDRIARLIDQAQRDIDDGPVVTVLRLPGAVVHSCDLFADRRWPVFGPLARQLGVGAALCHRLSTRAGPAGVLSVYADRRHAFSVDSDRTARLLALYSGIAVDAETARRNLQEAASTRDLVGQAKGILMERLHVAAEEALSTLVSRSEAQRLKLRDVADHLVATGELP